MLRGPQGTLFGRNTIGGVISVTTKSPATPSRLRPRCRPPTTTGAASGPRSQARIAPGLVNGKISAIYDVRDGTSQNLFLDRAVNDRNIFNARGQLAFEFGADTRLLLTADYERVRQEPLMFETLKSNPDATVTQLLHQLGLPTNTDPYDYKVLGDTVSREKLEARGFAATLNTALGGVKVTNIASYHYHDYYSRTDTDRTPLSIAYDGDPEEVWRASEELRFDFSSGPVDWLAGVYAYRQHSKNLSFIEVGSDLAAVLARRPGRRADRFQRRPAHDQPRGLRQRHLARDRPFRADRRRPLHA